MRLWRFGRKFTAERCQELSQGYAFFAYPWKENLINIRTSDGVRGIGVGAVVKRPSLRTGQAVFPHTAATIAVWHPLPATAGSFSLG
jgi:hypothetical protein